MNVTRGLKGLAGLKVTSCSELCSAGEVSIESFFDNADLKKSVRSGNEEAAPTSCVSRAMVSSRLGLESESDEWLSLALSRFDGHLLVFLELEAMTLHEKQRAVVNCLI